ncbi:MAG: DsbA family protein [Candidatus Helarchaeota archaeon]|nr:DsbA family protein [Candidatus Helarchaeota archaeon]
MQPIKVVIFSDYLCPFCFLANEIVKRIKKKFNLNVIWRPYDLHPVRSMMPPIDSPYIKMAWLNVQRLAKENNIEIKLPSYLSLSRKALETAEFAREYSVFNECHNRIFNAYFLEGKDIENEKTLLEIVKELKLDLEELKQKWKEETYYNAIKNSIRELHSVGITAVPAFFIGNEKQRIMVGVHPQEQLEKVILKAQAEMEY